MKTVAIISQKGGAGKTTIALNLAVAAVQLNHQSLVIDIDSQSSAKEWRDLRTEELPVVISAQTSSDIYCTVDWVLSRAYFMRNLLPYF